MNSLEEIEVPVEAEVFDVTHPKLPENSYIFRMDSTQEIHSNPLLWGPDLKKLTKDSNRIFLRAARELVPGFESLTTDEICEVVILRGGLAYHLDEVFEEIFGSYLPRCFVGARRHRVSGDEFEAEISYSNFEPLPEAGVVVLGDTIATGSTLSRTLSEIRDELRRRECNIQKLIVFSAAAAFRGCSQLLKWEERFREWWPEFEVHLFAAEAIFGLDDGTHLRYRKPGEAIVPEATKEFVSRTFGDYESAYLPGNICAIFDWGDRNFKPDRHLRDVLQYSREARKQAKDEESLQFLKELEEGAKKELDKYNTSISSSE